MVTMNDAFTAVLITWAVSGPMGFLAGWIVRELFISRTGGDREQNQS